MAVNPNVVTLEFREFNELYQTTYVNYIEPPGSEDPEYVRYIEADNLPDYIDVVKQSDGEARITLNPLILNQSPGLKIINTYLRMNISYADKTNNTDYTSIKPLGALQIRVNIIPTVRLSASPSPINFSYILGDLAPSPTTVNVTGEHPWTATKTKNWVTLANASGTGIGSFTVEVEPTGLAVGTHTDTITLADFLFTVNIQLTLIISEADTDTTYLYVQPSNIRIDYTISGYLPIRQIELNASGNWTATASKPWVQLSQDSGSEGVAFFNLTLNESVALTLTQGVHLATVVFEQGGLVKTIYVTLNVYQLVESLLNDTDLYYTDDNNKIILSSLREDTFLSMSLSSSFENNVKTGVFAIPFYAGRGERRVGNFPKKVIGQRPMPLDPTIAKVFVPYAPALVNFTITEEDIISDQVFQTVPVNNVQFIKGHKPAGGWLSEMPNVRFLTKKGIAAFSFLSSGNVASAITVSGDISTSIAAPTVANPFYTCLLPLAQLSGLQVGQSLDITVLNHSLKVYLAPEGKDHAIIFWENKWGCYDTFETTGEVEVLNEYDAGTFKFRKDYLESETKTLSIEVGNSFKIDTGFVRSAKEVMGLNNLLKAVNVYVLYNGTLSKVNNTTKKLSISQTDREGTAFNLTFDNAIS